MRGAKFHLGPAPARPAGSYLSPGEDRLDLVRIFSPSRSTGAPVRVTSAVVTTTVAALLLTACGTGEPAESGPEVEAAIGLAVDAPRVILEEPGTGALRELRYRDLPEAETTAQELTLSVSSGFTQGVGTVSQVDPTAPAGGDVSTLILPLTATTTEPEPDEEETLTAAREVGIRVGNPTFTDTVQAADVNSAEGFQLTLREDERGQQSTISLAAPVEASENGRQIMEQYLLKFTSLPVLFPAEEVGVGATWTIDSRVTGEATQLQTVTYTITGIEGDVVDLDVEVSQRPSLGADTEGVTADTPEQLTVLNSNTTSVGTLEVDLSRPLPTAGQVSWTTRVIYGADTDVRVVQDSTTSLKFES